MASEKKKIVILGGGFGGVYAAMELEKRLKNDTSVEITLVNKDNFLLFTPMLHEVAASDLDATHIVNPIVKLLKKTQFFCGFVENIDLKQKSITVSHGLMNHTHELPYDQLVIALGSVTNFYNSQAIESACHTMKSLEDAIKIRSRIIALMDEADFECCADIRKRLLTFVVAGGGFAGVETIAGIGDFVRESLAFYSNLKEEHLRMVLINSGEFILPELSEKLGRYAQGQLAKDGIEIHCKCKVADVSDGIITLSTGEKIEASTIVWTAGTSGNPLIRALPCKKERDRIVVDEFLEVPDYPGVWALGDCAHILERATGKPYPPTAQHAIREARTLAHNITATITGGSKKAFSFKMLGQLASIGRRSGVANILGVNFSGFIAWFLWRSIYLMKLPRLEKKIRVAIDWTLDLAFTKDLVQFVHTPTKLITAEAKHSEETQARVAAAQS